MASDDPAERQEGWKRPPRLVPRELTAEEADVVRLVERIGPDAAAQLARWLDEEGARVELRARSSPPAVRLGIEWSVIAELRRRVRNAIQDTIERAPSDGEEE